MKKEGSYVYVFVNGKRIVKKKISKCDEVDIKIDFSGEVGSIKIRELGWVNVFNVDIDLPIRWKVKINGRVYKDIVISGIKEE